MKRFPLVRGDNHVKFVILAHRRSGSTLLQRSLDSHPAAEAFGELFHETERDRRMSFRARGRYYRDGADAAAFLRRNVFSGEPAGIRATGFRLMYHQSRATAGARRAWHLLRGDRDVRVIHVHRTNLLACYVSHQLGFATGQWVLPVGSRKRRIAVPPFRVELEQLIDFCRSIIAWQSKALKAFSHHAVLPIEYEEDLVGRFVDAMNRVQDFLGLPRKAVKASVRKQAVLPLARQISNFAELRRSARHTLCEEYLWTPAK